MPTQPKRKSPSLSFQRKLKPRVSWGWYLPSGTGASCSLIHTLPACRATSPLPGALRSEREKFSIRTTLRVSRRCIKPAARGIGALSMSPSTSILRVRAEWVRGILVVPWRSLHVSTLCHECTALPIRAPAVIPGPGRRERRKWWRKSGANYKCMELVRPSRASFIKTHRYISHDMWAGGVRFALCTSTSAPEMAAMMFLLRLLCRG